MRWMKKVWNVSWFRVVIEVEQVNDNLFLNTYENETTKFRANVDDKIAQTCQALMTFLGVGWTRDLLSRCNRKVSLKILQ